jgi:hypothetical protein
MSSYALIWQNRPLAKISQKREKMALSVNKGDNLSWIYNDFKFIFDIPNFIKQALLDIRSRYHNGGWL